MADKQETIELVIKADNLTSADLKAAAADIENLGAKSRKADKELESLNIDKAQIATFEEMKRVTDEMRTSIDKETVAFKKLKQEIKETENVQDEQLQTLAKSERELKENQKALNSQVKAYKKLAEEVKQFGLHTRNADEIQAKLTAEIKEAEIAAASLTARYKQRQTVLTSSYATEKKSLALTAEKTAADKEAATATELLSIAAKKVAAAAEKTAIADKAATKEKERVQVKTKEYAVSLFELTRALNKGEVSTAKFIQEEEKLRKQLNLTESQVKTTKKVVDALVAARKKSADAAEKIVKAEKAATEAAKKATIELKNQVHAEALLENQKRSAVASLKAYEIQLAKLNAAKNEGKLSTGNYIREEEKLRKQLKLTESQAKSTRKAIEADVNTHKAATKSTDALTTATRRLAQGYTVLLAATKAAEGVALAVKGYGDLESAITKVEKTTGLARDQVEAMAAELETMATDITPAATNELLRYAEVAGQMGVDSTEDIMRIVSAADALGVSTDLAGDEAALLAARILGMTGEGIPAIDNLSGAIVALGNSTKGSESEILHLTKEIVTGTRAMNFGAAASAGFGATLNELGQPAERSRSAIGDLTNVILDLANEGGAGLEQLINITGLTAEAIKDGLGKAPEQIVIKFIEGLKNAKDAGVTLKSSLSEVGITSKETNVVIGVLADNTDRLSRNVNLSNEEYIKGNAHLKEAAKAYADQDATLARLVNKFEALKAKVGEAFAPQVLTAANAFSDAMDDNESAIVGVMEILPELAEGLIEIGTSLDVMLSPFGGLGDVLDDVGNLFKIFINDFTLGLKAIGLGANELKLVWAQVTGDTVENIQKIKNESGKILDSMLGDLKDIKEAEARLNGESSRAFELFTETTKKYKDSIKDLTEVQQTELELLTKTNIVTGERAKYNKDAEDSYRNLSAALSRANNLRTIEERLTLKAAKGSREAAAATLEQDVAIRKLGEELAYYGTQQSNIEKLKAQGILTGVELTTVEKAITDAITERQKALVALVTVEKEKIVTDEKSINLSKSWIESDGKRVAVSELLNNTTKQSVTNDLLKSDSLQKLNGEVLKGVELQDYLTDATARANATSYEFVDSVIEQSDAVRALNVVESNLTTTIIKMKAELEASTAGLLEKKVLTLELKTAEESLIDTQKQKALLQEIEGKNSKQLQADQRVVLEQLKIIDEQYSRGELTLAEYTEKTKDLNVEAGLLASALDGITISTEKVTNALIAAGHATERAAAHEKLLAGNIEHTNEIRGAATALAQMYDRAVARSNATYESSGKSVGELNDKLAALGDEMDFLTRARMPSNLVGMGAFIKTLDDLNRVGITSEQTTARQALELNRYLEQVKIGTVDIDAMAAKVANADYYFSNLSDNQLAPLRAAIKDARSEFQSLSDEINSTFEDVQDRLDEILGNESDILKRKFAKEMTEMEALLTQATESGNDALIRKINLAISNLRRAQGLELKDNTSKSNIQSGKLGDDTGVKSGGGGSTTHTVTINLPTGKTSSVVVASVADANELISTLNALGEINLNGVG